MIPYGLGVRMAKVVIEGVDYYKASLDQPKGYLRNPFVFDTHCRECGKPVEPDQNNMCFISMLPDRMGLLCSPECAIFESLRYSAGGTR
jgi:hypothetical protein